MSKCLICNSETSFLTDPQIKATYAVCESCGFIYKKKEHHVTLEAEKAKYDLHHNSFESEGYVNIFKALINDYIKPLKITKKVLEYGSGPGPVLKELLLRENYQVTDYDPFFNNNLDYLNSQYQLITSTEVVEHFKNPMQEFTKLANLLIPGGYLVIMTNLRTMALPEFLTWWYKRDITHISFYTLESLAIIAKKNNLKIIETNNKKIIVFQKNN